MNVHHLELFYYVARYGGITPAVRNIPYGIQQPAVSSQMAQLEERLGVTLFRRRPFELTAEGKKLFEFIEPFFGNLEKIAAELQGGQARHIRIGASTIVLRKHLPELLKDARKRFAGLKISLCEGFPAQLEEFLNAGEIDLAITVIEKKPTSGLQLLTLLELHPVLLVEKQSPIKSAEQLWERDRIDEPLICLPQGEMLRRNFEQWLQKRGIDWFPAIEASSTDLIDTYVANGLGIGLSAVVLKDLPQNIRTLPLEGIPPVVIGALWRGRRTPLIESFLAEAEKHAKRLR